jgi:divalent metal cation (Fe/Co/Zn/Cd) transporter
LRDLSDAPAGVKETDTLRKTCLNVNGILSVEEIRARKSGPYLYVEVTVGVDGSISASAAHRFVFNFYAGFEFDLFCEDF